MNDWLTAPGAPAVLVTVARAEGSVPREAGTKMLVTAHTQFDTIGGGHLEHRALDIARSMLAGNRTPGSDPRGQTPVALAGNRTPGSDPRGQTPAALAGNLNPGSDPRRQTPAAPTSGSDPVGLTPGLGLRYERFPLGPSLGQCCGGVVWLAFEHVSGDVAAVLEALRSRRAEDSWRYTALDGAPACGVVDDSGRLLAGAQPPADLPRGQAGVTSDASGRRWMVDPILAPRAHLVLFGAGHVGAAIVRALAELPCTVTWVDEREDMFPPQRPHNVQIEATDTPEACVEEAPPGASYLVMTHSHALDQRLAEVILRRKDVGWFGLIGSATKRAQFTNRLEAKGLSAETMVCPIGLPGIINKAPAVIAASVAAQLLMVWEDRTKD